jgi:tripartite-type tricarboxylate transporter receptor subunit TctC
MEHYGGIDVRRLRGTRALLYRETVRALPRPTLGREWRRSAYEPAAVPPDEVKARIKADMPKWAKVIRDAGIRP